MIVVGLAAGLAVYVIADTLADAPPNAGAIMRRHFQLLLETFRRVTH